MRRVLLFVRQENAREFGLLAKAHVRGYTRQIGVEVRAYENSKQQANNSKALPFNACNLPGAQKEKIRDFLNGAPLVSIKEWSVPQGGMAAVREWAAGIFKERGGIARSPVFGNVLLDERSIRDSMSHGKPSKVRYQAFAAVADVIEKGVVVYVEQRGRDGQSAYISAPVRINGVDDIVTAMVHRDPNTQRMYLHGVTTKERLLSRRVSGADTSSGVERSGSSGAGDVFNILHNLMNFNRKP